MSNVTFLRNHSDASESEYRNIHGASIDPENVYPTDPIRAAFKAPGQAHSINVPVFRISPLGIECDITHSPEQINGCKVGDEVELTMFFGPQKTVYSGITIATKHTEGERTLIGFRFITKKSDEAFNRDRRKDRRWLCGDEFLPTGIAPNPLKFNDYIFFKIVDFSSNGMQIVTSLRNKTLIKGMALEGTISLPMVGQVHLFFRIISARVSTLNDREQLSLGCEYLDILPSSKDAIAQYILQFADGADVVSLKDSGLKVQSVARTTTFGFVKSKSDYEEVLKLRYAAYKSAGKIDHLKDHLDTADIFDSRARIITAKFNGRLIGSVRLMFHGADDTMEHEQFTSFPDSFPGRHEVVEVTRVCTDSNYRSSDLFASLMKQMALLIVQSKRRYMVGSATEKLTPIYEKLGFEKTSIKYRHKDLGDEEHEILIADIPMLLSGHGISLKVWVDTYADIADYLNNIHGVEFDPLKNLRIRTYQTLNKIIGLFKRRQ